MEKPQDFHPYLAVTITAVFHQRCVNKCVLVLLNKVCAPHDLLSLYKEICVCTKNGTSFSLLGFFSGQLLTYALVGVWMLAVIHTPVSVSKKGLGTRKHMSQNH